MALLERRRHRHDVIAKTKCRVYVLDSQSLARLSRRHPEIIKRIRKVAEARREFDTVLNKKAPRKQRAKSRQVKKKV